MKRHYVNKKSLIAYVNHALLDFYLRQSYPFNIDRSTNKKSLCGSNFERYMINVFNML